MIANAVKLEVACRNVKALERALELLRDEIAKATPPLFEVTTKAYQRKAQSLRCEITEYLAAHPEEVSLLLRPDFAQVPLTATAEMERLPY
jgi:hypothetical protein